MYHAERVSKPRGDVGGGRKPADGPLTRDGVSKASGNTKSGAKGDWWSSMFGGGASEASQEPDVPAAPARPGPLDRKRLGGGGLGKANDARAASAEAAPAGPDLTYPGPAGSEQMGAPRLTIKVRAQPTAAH